MRNHLIKLYREYGKSGQTVEEMAKKHGLNSVDMLRLIMMGDRYLTEMEENEKE